LANAGASNLKLKLAYTANNPIQQKQAAVIQQNLKAVGVDVQLVGMDATALSKKLQSVQTDFDMYLNGYIMGIDPDTFNSLFVTNGEANYMHYSNPKVDALFNQGRVEKDDAKRKAIYEDIQKTIADDAAFYPITENKRILAIDSRVKGIDQAGLVPVYTFEDMSKLSY
jgi:peptide/nickel transport system substrate-binding protein